MSAPSRAGAAALVAGLVAAATVAAWPYLQSRWDAGAADDRRAALVREVVAEGPAPRAGRVPVARAGAVGEPFARLRVPRFGADWEWPLLEGSGRASIDQGPGHYVGTPLPGARGNVGIAAHRAGHGDPFIDFDRLRPGDRVLVTQRATTWVYELTTRPVVVDADDVQVLDPTAGRTVTLTTCWPRWGSSRRMVAHGRLVDVRLG